MGQRHQVILVIPSLYFNENNCNNHEVEVVAIHHQWLYGELAIHLLKNFLGFYKNMYMNSEVKAKTKSGRSYPYDFSDEKRAQDILAAIYSLDLSLGYFHQTHKLDNANPESFDNNDGCTIIDLRNPEKPKYCFFSINGLEGNNNVFNSDFKPYSAKEYLNCYTENPDSDDLNKLETIEKWAELITEKEFNEIMQLTKSDEK